MSLLALFKSMKSVFRIVFTYFQSSSPPSTDSQACFPTDIPRQSWQAKVSMVSNFSRQKYSNLYSVGWWFPQRNDGSQQIQLMTGESKYGLHFSRQKYSNPHSVNWCFPTDIPRLSWPAKVSMVSNFPAKNIQILFQSTDASQPQHPPPPPDRYVH